jgi:hypothetical protein
VRGGGIIGSKTSVNDTYRCRLSPSARETTEGDALIAEYNMWPKVAVVLCLLSAVSNVHSGEGNKSDLAGKVQRLIEKLDSARFSERQAAAVELRKIGTPAVAKLREAVRRGTGLELQRRAEALLRAMRKDTVDRLVREATHAEIVERDLKKAVEICNRIIHHGRHSLVDDKTVSEDSLILSDAYVRLARL